MMKSKPLYALALIAVAVSATGAAQAADVRIKMGAFVPEVCAVVPISSPERTQDGVHIPRIRELCNTGGGYQLVLSYAPNTLKGTTASFAGKLIELDGSGRAVIAEAPGAVNRVSSLSLHKDGGINEPVSINLQLVRY